MCRPPVKACAARPLRHTECAYYKASGLLKMGIVKSDAKTRVVLPPLAGVIVPESAVHGQRVSLAAVEHIDLVGPPVVIDDADRHRVAELPGDGLHERVVPDRPVRVADDGRGAGAPPLPPRSPRPGQVPRRRSTCRCAARLRRGAA